MKAKDINMCPDRTYKSKLVKYANHNFNRGEQVAIRIWDIPKEMRYPEGIKYSFAYIKDGKRILGYDNCEGKGHHKHSGNMETPILFEGIEQIENLFEKEVKHLRGKI